LSKSFSVLSKNTLLTLAVWMCHPCCSVCTE
jgi:hypothetical protein